MDDNDNICNRKLLQNVIPHKSNKRGNNFIDKRGNTRLDFNEIKVINYVLIENYHKTVKYYCIVWVLTVLS